MSEIDLFRRIRDANGKSVRERQPRVAEVVVWLREQGAGEEVFWCVDHRREVGQLCYSPVNAPELHAKCAQVLVIPLDTEPPKESE